MEIYLKSRNMDLDALRAELKPVAEKRLKRSLILYEVSKVEDIQIDQKELETEAVNTFDYLQRSLPERDARRLTNRNMRDNVLSNVMVDMLTRKTIERLRDIFSGKLESTEVTHPEVIPAVAEEHLPESVAQESSSSDS
jgi:FKBP-type peptidyl-prolyl cis-trans isomerase (trigger factor)